MVLIPLAKKQVAKGDYDNPYATNRRANFNYAITDTYEAGIELTGTEVKSVRLGQVTIGDGYVTIRAGQAWLNNVNIAEYSAGNQFNVDQLRRRRLLLHKQEIKKIAEADATKGMAIVPLRVYLKKGFVKVLIGVGTGKQQFDKRETIKRRDQDRELGRINKNFK